MQVLIEVNFVSAKEMQKLNKEWRRRSYTPRVLSFYYGDRDPQGNIFLGEVLVNSKEKRHTDKLIAHGIKNLLKAFPS